MKEGGVSRDRAAPGWEHESHRESWQGRGLLEAEEEKTSLDRGTGRCVQDSQISQVPEGLERLRSEAVWVSHQLLQSVEGREEAGREERGFPCSVDSDFQGVDSARGRGGWRLAKSPRLHQHKVRASGTLHEVLCSSSTPMGCRLL